MSYAKLLLIGNLGSDVELKYTPQGTALGKFSVAVTEKKKDKQGEYQDVTLWYRCTVWGKQAENAAKYLAKGSSAYLEGSLSVDEWTDRDGKSRFTLEVNVSEVKFLGSKLEGSNNRAQSTSAGATANPFDNTVDGKSDTFVPNVEDDEIPF